MTEHKTVTITKTVPVDDRETLALWLEDWLALWMANEWEVEAPGVGSKALDLIEEAGFTVVPPASVARDKAIEALGR